MFTFYSRQITPAKPKRPIQISIRCLSLSQPLNVGKLKYLLLKLYTL